MGGIALGKYSSLETYFPNFHAQNWQEISTENRGRFGEFTILRNAITKQQIDKYQLMFISDREQKDYEQSFMNRLRQEYLVNGFHYEALKSKGMCSSVRGAIVYVQHIPIRLTDITDIPLPDSLYMVKCSLLGFKKLFEKIGYFNVIEEHIGIDREGHVRVWLNADFSKNYPFNYDQTSSNFKNQKVMVAQIVKLIQNNTSFESRESHANEFMSFSSFIQKNHNGNPNFYQAIDLIQSYALRNNIVISKHCTSVVEIFQEDYGEDFNLTNDDNFEDHLDLDDEGNFANGQENKSSEINPVEVRSQRSQEGFQYPNNMKSSRSFKQNSSVSQNNHKEGYREYEPISTYKPNQRVARLSSTENNIVPFYTNQQSLQSRQSQQSQRSQPSLHSSQSIHSHPSQSEINQRNSNHQQQIYNNPRLNSSRHESARNLERSNCSSETISKPQSRAFINGQIDQQLNGSQRSNTMGSNPNLRSSSSLPKVTFNYFNKQDIKPQANNENNFIPKQQQNNFNFYPMQPYKPSNNYKTLQTYNSNQKYHNNFYQQNSYNYNSFPYPKKQQNQIHKNSSGSNEIIYNSYNQEIIVEDDDQDMDPEIIGDLLKEFPTLELSG